MKKFVFVLAVAFVQLSASIETYAAEGKPQFLFVQSAKTMKFASGVLTLQGVSPNTVFFSDRPKRIVGHVRNDLFVNLWSKGKNSFKKDPPNASLSVFNADGRAAQAVVILTNPRIDGDSFVYDVRVLEGKLPSAGGESSLFIDGDSAPCPNVDNTSGYPGPCWAQEAFSDDR